MTKEIQMRKFETLKENIKNLIISKEYNNINEINLNEFDYLDFLFYFEDLNESEILNNKDEIPIINLNNWDVSKIISMKGIFYRSFFNFNISDWNTSNVINMEAMFQEAKNFNCDISNWDTSNVETMKKMFHGATSFNNDIAKWNTSNVIDMTAMFKNAKSFNCDINTNKIDENLVWDVSNVTSMSNMFHDAESFNGYISNWNTSNVKFMGSMFKNAIKFNRNIDTIIYSNINSYKEQLELSYNALESLNKTIQELKNKDSYSNELNEYNKKYMENIDKYTELVKIAEHGIMLNQKMAWDISNVKVMSFIFDGANDFAGEISHWNTLNIVNMESFFRNAKNFNCDISRWNTSNVVNMRQMFQNAIKFNRDINTNLINNQFVWDTSKVVQMDFMFDNAINFKGNISNWNFRNLITMKGMFNNIEINYEYINTKPCFFDGKFYYYSWKIYYDHIIHNIDLTQVNWKNKIDDYSLYEYNQYI